MRQRCDRHHNVISILHFLITWNGLAGQGGREVKYGSLVEKLPSIFQRVGMHSDLYVSDVTSVLSVTIQRYLRDMLAGFRRRL